MKRNKRWKIWISAIVFSVMFAASAYAFGPGSSGPDVYAVQSMLKSIGYYQGPIDGLYGEGTSAGVRGYQQAAGLTVSGIVDTATLRSILGTYARAKLDGAVNGSAGAGNGGKGNGTGAAAGNNTGAGTYTLSADEQQMVALVNQARQEAGLPALSVHASLSRVARIKSGDMAQNNYFSHDSPTYGSPFNMMNNFGIGYSAAGENIACNQTTENAHTALMNSPGHRANILSSDYTHIGIGIQSGGKCGAMYTQMFLKP
ncbi:CAP domain-containing protein [Paenibacillus thermotolerans]|uniref:CAP domain-containing protein n=1 Tax=Paenibacillus thermotolerans TaxID=3027807 RepID=UPI002368A9FA|nr:MULTISPECIES: CAP domain-containing protein [unclassified Paenibacillus]